MRLFGKCVGATNGGVGMFFLFHGEYLMAAAGIGIALVFLLSDAAL